MKEVKCLNVSDCGKRCKALKLLQCPVECFAKITDPETYIDMLGQLITANYDTNKQLIADYRKEIRGIQEKYNLPIAALEIGKYAGWEKDYYDGLKRRPGGGGGGEKDTNPSKPRENDNRVLETRWTKDERDKLMEETKKWEEEHGKLEKLSRSPLTRNKIDSYTGEPIK